MKRDIISGNLPARLRCSLRKDLTLRILPALTFTLLLAAHSETVLSAGGYSAPESSPTSRLYQQADRLIQAEKYADAIVELKKIVASNPQEADAFNLLGYSYRMLKDYDNSETNYKTALRLDPDHKKALNYVGHLYLETDRPEEALATLGKLDEVCFLGCAEYSELKEAIEASGAGQ
jgi:Flp pilus assembly protein TadD